MLTHSSRKVGGYAGIERLVPAFEYIAKKHMQSNIRYTLVNRCAAQSPVPRRERIEAPLVIIFGRALMRNIWFG